LRKGFGAAFWAAMLIALTLILAGAVVGFFGPRLFPLHPHGHAPATPPRLGNPPPSG